MAKKSFAKVNIPDFKVDLKLKMPKLKAEHNAKQLSNYGIAAITRGIAQGTDLVQPKLTAALNRAMSSKKWDWPNITHRRNGKTAGTSRNIVDLGSLKGSLSVEGKAKRTKALIIITYDSPYAAMTYYGGVIANPYGNNSAASVVIPGRPWVEAILYGTHGQPKFNLTGPFKTAIKQEWNRAFGF